MEIIKLLKTRRSIRRYKARAIPKKLLMKILDAARWAPSAHNQQPWKFIVVEKKTKKQLAEVLKKRQGKEPLFVRLVLKNAIAIIENAPTVIVAYKDEPISKNQKMLGRPYYDNANMLEAQSVSCALQNMLLRAHSLGLGAVWLGICVYRQKQINRFFNAEDKLMAVLAIGYPDENPKAPARKPISEIAIFKE